MQRALIVIGCLLGASFFVACQQMDSSGEESSAQTEETKELQMQETSELALLMRKMYDDNMELREQLLEGQIPRSFPDDFKKIHTADATDPEELQETFDALATEYLRHIQAITKAENPGEAKRSYNNMIQTCASCHEMYCQGPLAKIRRMRIKDLEGDS